MEPTDDYKLHDGEGAITVTFSCYMAGSTQEQTVSFFVESDYLYSGPGLAAMFERTRDCFLVHPGGKGFDEDAWNSWHLVGIGNTGYLLIQASPGPS